MPLFKEQPQQQSDFSLRVGLIGNPVAHSFSPRMQQAAFDVLGINARYELWQTYDDELPTTVASLLHPDCLGANITIPHKEAVLPLVDLVEPMASSIGAINTIVHQGGYLHGYNTDAPGLLLALHEQGLGTLRGEADVSLKNHTVFLLGAGGAARAAAFALAHASVKRLIILNRHLEKAQRIAAEVQKSCDCSIFCVSDPEFLIPHSQAIIINATSVGLHEDVSPLSSEVLERFDQETFVYDMIYNPSQTRLLIQAAALGLPNANGLSMLLHQGALSFNLWTGHPPPLEIMRRALFQSA